MDSRKISLRWWHATNVNPLERQVDTIERSKTAHNLLLLVHCVRRHTTTCWEGSGHKREVSGRWEIWGRGWMACRHPSRSQTNHYSGNFIFPILYATPSNTIHHVCLFFRASRDALVCIGKHKTSSLNLDNHQISNYRSWRIFTVWIK